MAGGKYVRAECDICRAPAYDRVNHPQNKTPDLRDNSQYDLNARPDPNIDRNINWEDATERHTTIYQWELTDINWNSV